MHKIILPDYSNVSVRSEIGSLVTIWNCSRCLMILPLFYDNVSVICDNGLLTEKVSHILTNAPFIANKNNSLANLFVIDSHVFMILNTDTPAVNHRLWIPHYSQHISGIFMLCNRHSTSFLFDNFDVAVLPLSIKSDPSVPLLSFECDAHSKSVTIEKDISVFFHGRYGTRLSRKYFAKLIQKNITDTHIQDSGDYKVLSGSKYVDLMSRSKIVWCPRSVKSKPDHECNAVTARECETMCLECLVVRPSIGITETEDRIPGVHFVEIQNDSSDLIENLQYYLEHDDERKEIAHNGRLWWERNCSVVSRAKQIYSDCIKTMEEKS